MATEPRKRRSFGSDYNLDQMSLEDYVRYELAKMIAKRPAAYKRLCKNVGLTPRKNLLTNYPKGNYLIHCSVKSFLLDLYTARTFKAHADVVDEMAENFENGKDIFTGEDRDEEYFGNDAHEYLTDAERTFIAKVMSLAKPIDSRKKKLIGLVGAT